MSLSLSALLLLMAPAAADVPAPATRLSEPHSAASQQEAWYFIKATNIKYAQVRIEKRIIIRVPRRRLTNTRNMVDFAQRSPPPVYKEKKIGKCLPMKNILGVQMFGERYLDLVTRDRKRIRARLEKKCQARSFYSGFYMEKSSDGRICAGRDILHSRTGAKCEIDRFRQLVAQK